MNLPRQPRVVSLISSATEIICALGYEHLLVGRSHECDYPRSVLKLPQVTSPKFPTDGTSYEIHERVKAIVQEGLSVYRVDAAELESLKPDLIVTQTQCQVCAVSLSDVEEAVCEFIGKASAKILSLEAYDLNGVWEDIRKVAEALSAPEAAEKLIANLKLRLQKIRDLSSPEPRVGIACVEWMDPLMSAGHWTPELAEVAGGEMYFGKRGEHSPWLSWEELVKADPEVIVVAPCGLDLPKILAEWPKFIRHSEYQKLSAVKNKRVYLADGNQFFNRPGPRLVETAEILAEILHPKLCDFGHHGPSWISTSEQ